MKIDAARFVRHFFEGVYVRVERRWPATRGWEEVGSYVLDNDEIIGI